MTASTSAAGAGDLDPTPAQGAAETPRRPRRPQLPLTYGRKSNVEIVFLWFFVVAPLVAVAAAVPVAWTGGWLGWTDVILFAVMYLFTGLGVTVGFHRYLTHGAFKAKRPMRILLTVAGTMAIEGAPIRWVADHRRHHQFSDDENDPHSPWRFGETVPALAKGMIWAHMGWLFTRENSNSRRFAPDLVADRDIRFIQKNFVWFLLLSLFGPAIVGGLVSQSWHGFVTAYFWAGLVRIALIHHVTWAVNSVCHVMGERPFKTSQKDRASNVWLLAVPSFGESWHNLHHADPTCARHGVDPGQIDISARVIWLFEKAGWVWNVKWPKENRIDAKRVEQAA
ncbi:acyl-CoA desaturase [Kineosporia rhizophila]|uniref:acyl-CoA desaturase n=1 Tax=Kineosporia TaxID=49184 RepID=UPI001E36CFBB|nr:MULTISPECIES: acyl-CoA desaturase [Kineosporia]MCE0540154.1 acyl-CoA desaturase [Kineosporia rhizophila]GLY14344.1 stearoyl-CoA desaturase [Kineosporia sp. NBRC 101677]